MSVCQDTAAGLVRSIFRLQRLLRASSAAVVEPSDLGQALTGVLRLIGENSGARASDIAALLGVGAPVLSRHIAELEALGMVVRQPDPADGRAHLLSLSERGGSYLLGIEKRRAVRIQNLLSGWSEQRAWETEQAINQLSEALRAVSTHPHRSTRSGQKGTMSRIDRGDS